MKSFNAMVAIKMLPSVCITETLLLTHALHNENEIRNAEFAIV